MENKNIPTINRAISFYIFFTLLIVIGVILFQYGYNEFGIVLLGSSLVGYLIAFFYFTPQAQRLQITNKGIVFYSYRQCRTYFWIQIKDVKIIKNFENNTCEKKLVVEMFHPGSNRAQPDNFFEVPINAEVYGYSPDELKKIIKKNISQPATPHRLAQTHR